jgi:hypothetical protein
MKSKIVRHQKLMWRNIMKSTKNKKKVSVLHYSIDIDKPETVCLWQVFLATKISFPSY